MAENDGANAPRDTKRYAALPRRIPLEDTIETSDASTPAHEVEKDENREVAWRWGIGIAPGG